MNFTLPQPSPSSEREQETPWVRKLSSCWRREGESVNLRSISTECRHIRRHSRESGNPEAIGNKCVLASHRILDSRFLRNDGKRGLETDILKLTTLSR